MSVSHCEAVTVTLMSKVCETVSVTQTIVTVTTVLLLNFNKSVINLVWLDRGRTGGIQILPSLSPACCLLIEAGQQEQRHKPQPHAMKRGQRFLVSCAARAAVVHLVSEVFLTGTFMRN